MPGLRFDDKLSLELTHAFDRPLSPGRDLSASLPRHFVPGYYPAVPPGQKIIRPSKRFALSPPMG
jgi:hypothetical protein